MDKKEFKKIAKEVVNTIFEYSYKEYTHITFDSITIDSELHQMTAYMLVSFTWSSVYHVVVTYDIELHTIYYNALRINTQETINSFTKLGTITL